MQTLICTTKSACGYIIDTKSNEELAEKLGLLRSKRDMALLIAEKILEDVEMTDVEESEYLASDDIEWTVIR